MIEVKKNNFLFNEEVNKCLKSIIKKKSFANGYIFYGPEGVGKKQTALQFIKEILKEYSPSGNIEERITNNNHPDFLTIEPSSLLEDKRLKSSDLEKTTKSRSEVIKIAQIRNIKTFLGQKSINSEKKVILIIDAHLLNEAASNCLLKTLEEPSNGIFILLTSKFIQIPSEIRKVIMEVQRATPRVFRTITASSPRIKVINRAPTRGAKITTESQGKSDIF